MPTNSKRWIIKPKEEGRLDLFLTAQFKDVSRAYLQEVISSGKVTVNGKPATKSTELKKGDEVRLQGFTHPKERRIEPNPNIHLNLIWKSEDLIVINKPPGLPTHPNDFKDKDTVANAFVAIYPDSSQVGEDPLRPGIVHRLDGDTSGLLILAITQKGFTYMRKQFDERKVKKTYIACVLGDIPKPGKVSFPIAHHPKNPRKMIALKKGKESTRGKSREAVTMFEPIERFKKGYTLLRVKTLTGRMHQVRIHLSSIGHPLVGDSLYQSSKEKELDRTGLDRHFLHAAHLEFTGPDAKNIVLDSELARDLKMILMLLREPNMAHD
jgi:23S rRNA pseudouridine1911/1915/1917 synthase